VYESNKSVFDEPIKKIEQPKRRIPQRLTEKNMDVSYMGFRKNGSI